MTTTPPPERDVELKPCPCCAGEAVMLSHVDGKELKRVMCSNAACAHGQIFWKDVAEAIAAWNRRASSERAEWRTFDPAAMQELGWYMVQFQDGSTGDDTWDEGDWQQIEPEAVVVRVLPLPAPPEGEKK